MFNEILEETRVRVCRVRERRVDHAEKINAI